jgi:hypothetical protein
MDAACARIGNHPRDGSAKTASIEIAAIGIDRIVTQKPS